MSSKTPVESKLSHGNQRPKIKHAKAFMPVLITSNFDNDWINVSIKNERTSIDTPFSQ